MRVFFKKKKKKKKKNRIFEFRTFLFFFCNSLSLYLYLSLSIHISLSLSSRRSTPKTKSQLYLLYNITFLTIQQLLLLSLSLLLFFYHQRSTRSPYNSLFEFEIPAPDGSHVPWQLMVTSVTGHLLDLDFEGENRYLLLVIYRIHLFLFDEMNLR